ncbi:hypothetical protein D3X11_06590 [Streptococcus sp. X16XC17]|uniref:hypothetical protein n=1 Tax=unclassified Streptococcus TaxID=2608887 RepID=UPI00066FF3A1|nr:MULTISPECIES: hypothetical protein [unclassified Streptococcus]TCD45863.1 hypothetical protein D3X11_06590 [Streptococcus sp. X16XC17]
MFRKFMKSIALLTICSGPMFLSVEDSLQTRIGQTVYAMEGETPRFHSSGGSEFEPDTFKMELQVGEKGQIRRPQNSPLKDFIYSFDMHVNDPPIISFDE